jgi:hypothetical protein
MRSIGSSEQPWLFDSTKHTAEEERHALGALPTALRRLAATSLWFPLRPPNSITRNEPECSCSCHGFDLAVDSQAAKRGLQIPTNRMWAKEEALGDERNGGSSGKQPQDFCLARRELAYARAFGSGSAVGS